MTIKSLFASLFLIPALLAVSPYQDVCCAANGGSGKTDISIDVNKEDKEVGLRRMEIIDKVLSQDLLNRKMNMVRRVESEYNEKAQAIIDGIIPPVFDSKVFTHIEVNFFSPEFEAEVNANQKVYLSFILRQDGFNRWAKRYPSSQDALSSMKKLLSDSLRIPEHNISGTVID